MEKRVRKTPINSEIISLGKRIEELIKLKGLKTRAVAHDADLDLENLRKYIKGKQEMKVSTMLKIAKALDVNLSDLFSFIQSN